MDVCPRCKTNGFIKLSTGSVCYNCGFEECLIQETALNISQGNTQDIEKIKRANQIALNKFKYHLNKNDTNLGIKYFKEERKLTDETIKKFQLGFSEKNGAGINYKLQDIGYSEEEMLSTGLVGKGNKYYDKFWNRVMFPIFDVDGNIIGFGGRRLGENDSPKYINSPETQIFHKKDNLFAFNFAKENPFNSVILCEGYMDVIALHQAGITNAIAALGTALTKEQAKLIKQYKTTVYIAFDSDEAGTIATKRAIPILNEAGLKIKRIDLGSFKDPDELIKAEGVGSFKRRIKLATSADKFLYTVSDNKTAVLKKSILEKIKGED